MATVSVSTLGLADFHSTHIPAGLFVFEDGGIAGSFPAPAARKLLLDEAKAEGFKGAAGEIASVSASDKGSKRRFVLAGLGPRKKLSPETVRRGAAAIYKYAQSRFEKIAVSAFLHPQAAAEGLLLSSYKFDEYRKPEKEKLSSAALLVSNAAQRQAFERAIAKASLYCDSVCFVRDLVNRGPSDKSPESLAELAKGLAGDGVSVDVISRQEAQKLGMGSFLAVARGSSAEPVMLHLTYKPKGGARRKVGLVGKGITFDSGGLSLKPPQSMETMKCDMAGAASVLSVFKALPKLKPRAEVHGVCAFTYNMPGPDAIKPGDVVRASNGKSIEILNTDAEGRLVLADALVYATQLKLDGVIDLATLTGAVVVALGAKVTGAMGNDKRLLGALGAAAAKTEEALCELPLVMDYKEQIKSPIADLQNIGKVRGEAGSIIGGLFLEEFVDGKPWVHLDIAGTAWNDSPSAYCPAGGTGSIVRTLLEYISNL
ncbi:MAG: leucyl aminopeptidase [Elusimicrobia bacterium]|nr:leucyl aminopeptidase [Elusimicrobiota bacterium]